MSVVTNPFPAPKLVSSVPLTVYRCKAIAVEGVPLVFESFAHPFRPTDARRIRQTADRRTVFLFTSIFSGVKLSAKRTPSCITIRNRRVSAPQLASSKPEPRSGDMSTPIKTVLIYGYGVMGRGVAKTFADA